MDWARCIKCFAGIGEERNCYLASCTHILCDRCIHNRKCPMCHQTVQVNKIDASMPPEMKMCFQNKVELLEKGTKKTKFQMKCLQNTTRKVLTMVQRGSKVLHDSDIAVEKQRMETYRLAQSLDKIKQKHQLSHQKLLKKMIELDHTKETYEKTQFYVKHRF